MVDLWPLCVLIASYTQAPAHTHERAYPYRHIDTQTYTQMRAHSHRDTVTQTHTHTHTNAYTQTPRHSHTHGDQEPGKGGMSGDRAHAECWESGSGDQPPSGGWTLYRPVQQPLND